MVGYNGSYLVIAAGITIFIIVGRVDRNTQGETVMLQSISIISTTVSTPEQAEAIAKQLVESRLAGCVQIDGPIQSIYCWEGRVCNEPEYRLNIKTLPIYTDQLLASIGKLHPYQTPELLVSSLECSEDYHRWLSDQVA